jgi:hypothetical protein
VSALVERNRRLDAIKPDRTGQRQSWLPRYHAMKPAAAITLRNADRSSCLPRETLDFLHDKRSVRSIRLQQALGLAVLHDLSILQDDDPVKIP